MSPDDSYGFIYNFQPCNLTNIYTRQQKPGRRDTADVMRVQEFNKWMFYPQLLINHSWIIIVLNSGDTMAPRCFFEHLHDHQITLHRSLALSWKGQPLWCSGLVECQWSILAEGWRSVWRPRTDGGISLTGADHRQLMYLFSGDKKDRNEHLWVHHEVFIEAFYLLGYSGHELQLPSISLSVSSIDYSVDPSVFWTLWSRDRYSTLTRYPWHLLWIFRVPRRWFSAVADKDCLRRGGEKNPMGTRSVWSYVLKLYRIMVWNIYICFQML